MVDQIPLLIIGDDGFSDCWFYDEAGEFAGWTSRKKSIGGTAVILHEEHSSLEPWIIETVMGMKVLELFTTKLVP